MVRNLKGKRKRGGDSIKSLYTEEGWVVAEEVENGCFVITDRSTTFIPNCFLMHLIDDDDISLGWTVEREIWGVQ